MEPGTGSKLRGLRRVLHPQEGHALMANRVGQQLGNYRLVRLLGQGGFADAYLGQHWRLDSEAAIKVLHAHLALEDWENFRKEARIIAGLVHPHIVRLLDFDIEDGKPFLVMQYAPNGTLRRRHAQGNPLALEIILPYTCQVASALQYIHERRLIHRDIKPENLLLGERGEALLSDFGVAIIAQSSRQQSNHTISGTVTYMAPEQIQSKPVPASDQYALGVVVYEWLTGQRPFAGSFTEIATKQILVPPSALRALVPTIAPAVEAVVLRALAKDPTNSVYAVDWSRDGRSIVTASRDKRVIVWDTRTGQALLPYSGHSGAVNAVAWSPDGTRIASGSSDLTVQVWDAQSGRALYAYRGHRSYVGTVAWSPDGSKIASGSGDPYADRDHSVQVWDAQIAATLQTYTGHAAQIKQVAWSPDGKYIASGAGNTNMPQKTHDTTVQVWEPTGHFLYQYRGHTSVIEAVVWSPDSTRVASASDDTTARVWEAVQRLPQFPDYLRSCKRSR